MLLSEEEAKTKWCPHAVASHTDPRGGFREDDRPDTYRSHPCIASRCMAWRWNERAGDVRFSAMDAKGPGPDWIDEGEVESVTKVPTKRWRRPTPNRTGFCGLSLAPIHP